MHEEMERAGPAGQPESENSKCHSNPANSKQHRIKLLDNVRNENDFNLSCYFYAFEIKWSAEKKTKERKKKKKVMRKNRVLRNLLFISMQYKLWMNAIEWET